MWSVRSVTMTYDSPIINLWTRLIEHVQRPKAIDNDLVIDKDRKPSVTMSYVSRLTGHQPVDSSPRTCTGPM